MKLSELLSFACVTDTGPVSRAAMMSCTRGTRAHTSGGFSIVSASAGDVNSRRLFVWGHLKSPALNFSGSQVSLPDSLLSLSRQPRASNLLPFTLLTRRHLSWPSKLWKADRRPRRVLDRRAKSDSDFDSPFWDCQSVACNVPWHFHNLQRVLNALSSSEIRFPQGRASVFLQFRKLLKRWQIRPEFASAHLSVSLFLFFF